MQTITFKCNKTTLKQLEEIKKDLLKLGIDMNTSQLIRYCILETCRNITK